jgi:hypothetical protein
MSTERTGGPGPRKEIGDVESSRVHPPHVTENDRGAQFQGSTQAPNEVPGLPANAHGRDVTDAHEEVRRVDDESAYERRPGEDKDRRETDMP